jgi:diaminohydroxyphosphoribosylaminopyrimidine deaminase/5-amino-6-(5-phosphoribosylamino)uracil reductase
LENDFFMRQAILLALHGRGKVSPNPMVGAVLVKKGKIIGEGYHAFHGGAHAEIDAIEKASEDVRGATLYCTLEPCCHLDKLTPPCTRRIISEKIARVVIGTIDPNPKVNGQGLAELRAAGIEVESGVLEEDCQILIDKYSFFITHPRPFTALKLAATLDGFIADKNGNSRWISGSDSRKKVQELRREYDAIVVGARTFRKDDPQLTLRSETQSNPRRILLNPEYEAFFQSRIAQLADPEKTIIVLPEDKSGVRKNQFVDRGHQVLGAPMLAEGFNLNELWQRLRLEAGVYSLLVEGGGKLAGNLLEAGLIQRILWFTSPGLLGQGTRAISGFSGKTIEAMLRPNVHSIDVIGHDVLITAEIPWEKN